MEKAGETAGYSYDGSIYTVTVEVTDIGGKLTNTVTYVKDDAAAGAAAPTAAEFINTYDAGKTNAVLTATTFIKGTPAKEFNTFELCIRTVWQKKTFWIPRALPVRKRETSPKSRTTRQWALTPTRS